MNRINEFILNESGQGMVEYALILVLISLGVIALLGAIGSKLKNVFNNEELLNALS